MHDSLRKARSLIASAAVLGFLATPGLAEERKFEWSVTATGTSDYIFRGISLSNENPVFQSSIDGSYGIWYFGAWGTDLSSEGQVEIDFYTGIKPVWGPVTFDLGVVYYTYFWDNPSDTNYVEFKLGAEFSPIKNLTLTPVLWYQPDQDNVTEVVTIEGTAAYELPTIGIFTPTISGLIGYTDGDDADTFATGEDSYTYWNVGLALAVEKFTFDFRYWDTNLDSAAGETWFGLDDERFVFTASITLP